MSFGLGSEHPFGRITMSVTLAIFLVGVLHGYLLIHEILAVHVGNCIIGSLKV
jgi:hypothetical protein